MNCRGTCCNLHLARVRANHMVSVEAARLFGRIYCIQKWNDRWSVVTVHALEIDSKQYQIVFGGSSHWRSQMADAQLSSAIWRWTRWMWWYKLDWRTICGHFHGRWALNQWPEQLLAGTWLKWLHGFKLKRRKNAEFYYKYFYLRA